MNGRPWLQVHTDALSALAGVCSDGEIGRLTGHAAITVRTRRKRLGLPAYHPGHRAVTYGTWEDLSDVSREAIRRATRSGIAC